MGSLVCTDLLLAGFVCAWKTNFLSKTGDKKCKKKSVRELNPCQTICESRYIPLVHHLALPYYCSGTMYKPTDNFFF